MRAAFLGDDHEEILDQPNTWRGGHLWPLKWHREAVWWRAGDPDSFGSGTTTASSGWFTIIPFDTPRMRTSAPQPPPAFVGMLSALPIRAAVVVLRMVVECAMEAYAEV